MAMNQPRSSREVVIRSDAAEGRLIQDEILGAVEARHYTPHDVFGIRLALEEALVNAIKHGNGADPAKTVRIAYQVDDDRVRVEIEDQGTGFDPGDVPDPTLPENLERPSGRGIMLMRSFMDLVQYNDRGNCVILEKQRGLSAHD
jgi:serine/threonine-protein kinase RsbW